MAGYPLMTKTHFDSLDDDPQQAQAEFTANVDAFNWVAAALNGGAAGLPLIGSGDGSAPVFTQVGTGGIQNSAITQQKIADDAVGLSQLGHGTSGKLIGFGADGSPQEISILNGMGLENYFQIRHSDVMSSTGGGSYITAGVEQAVPWNGNFDINNIGVYKYSDEGIVVPAGTYFMRCARTAYAIGRARLRLSQGSTPSIHGPNFNDTVNNGIVLTLSGVITLPVQSTITVKIIGSQAKATNGLGLPLPSSWYADNEYGFWVGWKIA
ncbi:MAG: hypothetical protein HQL90_08475 [Magnetococcales bacterium]|nr:hypothetical protein [Magnetococcales bacterium]